MSENQTNASPVDQQAGGYGYASDDVKVSTFNFGGNFGKTTLEKFEWIPNGGTGGAEQEALEIIFKINGTEKSSRMFPVVKAFGKNNEEITDPNAQEFKDAMTDFNSKITHILHCFIEADAIKAGFSRPIKSFKEFCQIAMSMLPTNYKNINLDIFLQYQWQPSQGKNRTYLEIPTKMKYGRFLSKAIPGDWKEVRVENPNETMNEALYYVNEKGEKHPFVKNGWFMLSNFAKLQKIGNDDTSASSTGTTSTTSVVASQAQTDGEKKASAW